MSAPGLALRVSQQLSLTPQLQQSIRLLQLSTLELEQEIGQMLADNPFLEQEDEDQHAPGPGSEPGSTEPAGGEEAAAPQEAPDAAGRLLIAPELRQFAQLEKTVYLVGQGDRSFFVDRIPAELVERIEIIRSPRADQPSDGMAGSLNVVLKEGATLTGGFV